MKKPSIKKKVSFYFITLMAVVFLIEFFSFVTFITIEKKWFSFSRIYSERINRSHEVDILTSASVQNTIYFLDILENADIITEEGNSKVIEKIFSFNGVNENRKVLFQHPNSEVTFKDVPIHENAKLVFGIGIDQAAWDKSGDGVLFEITIVNESGHNNVIFTRYIDPKNNLQNRKWFDSIIDLQTFSGQKVSFVFKTTGGPQGSTEYDWAGWSNPRITSGGKKNVRDRVPAVEVVHPYLGYVYDPESTSSFEGLCQFESNIPISSFGFIDETGPIHAKSNDKVILGIFGGSVACWFSTEGINSLINELRKLPLFFNKEIVVVSIAAGGYKQPQQLIALSYLLALGAEFDIIINLDGFNEVALPPTENIPNNVFPFYPRDWLLRVQNLPDPVLLSLVGEITYLKSKRSKWARLFSMAPFRYSITMNLIWKYYDQHLAMETSRSRLILQSYNPKVSSYAATGPSRYYENEDDMFKDLTSVWKRSSIQMQRLCNANGIRYFHFLQPNLYVSGSKILAEEEFKLTLISHPYKKAAERGIPYLIKAGEELVSQGVNFHDLTMIFADKAVPIYVDCCHFNKTGNDILGTVIGQAIIQDINTENIQRKNPVSQKAIILE